MEIQRAKHSQNASEEETKVGRYEKYENLL